MYTIRILEDFKPFFTVILDSITSLKWLWALLDIQVINVWVIICNNIHYAVVLSQNSWVPNPGPNFFMDLKSVQKQMIYLFYAFNLNKGKEGLCSTYGEFN